MAKNFFLKWLWENTEDCTAVVEFGAGFFQQLSRVHKNVRYRVGIEVYKPYHVNAKFTKCLMVLADMRDFDKHLKEKHYDCAMFVDSLEHLTMEDAKTLMKRVQAKFRKVLLMIPEGEHPQTKDVTGHGGHAEQTHRSTWCKEDVEALGFQDVYLDPKFHRGVAGCIFAVWERDKDVSKR